MHKGNVITAIDVGTDKVVTLIATYDEEHPQLRIVGVSAVSSSGVKRSMIVDLEAVLHSIEQSVDAAERMAGFGIESAYVSVSGQHIKSRNSNGVVAVAQPDQEITPIDVERVIEAARAVSVPSEREIIHVVPRYFKVDSQEDIRDPVGMAGVRLESEAHIITGMSTSLRNLEKCLNDLGINVDAFVFSGLAAAEATLTDTEKELGSVAFDIGAGTSSFCVYVDGVLEFSGSLPIGARHITQDIAVGTHISLDNAEKLKLALKKLNKKLTPLPGESKRDFNLRKKKLDVIDLENLGIRENVEEISRSTLIKGIMMPRIEEILTMLGEELDKKGLIKEVPAGIILSGGGAETVGLDEAAKKILGLPARVAQPKDLDGLIGEIRTPNYATSIGLLLFGKQQGGGQEMKSGVNFSEVFNKIHLDGVGQKVAKLFKSLLP